MENNIFGYEFLGVKILELPSEEDAGYFINNITNKKVSKDDMIDRNSELRFILSDEFKTDIFSIVFVGVISEPSYDRMNEFAEEKKTVDMAEIWRQNYADAKDEIRNLKLRISELESENEMLLEQISDSK
jgi:hypothetical protein